MAGFRQENRVGTGATPAPSPTPRVTSRPTPKPSPSSTQKLGTFDASKIVSDFEKQTGTKLSVDAGSIGGGEPLIDSLSASQKTALVKLMKKLGYTIQSSSELKTTLNGYYPNEYNKATSFENLYSMLAADYIPGASNAGSSAGQNLPTQTVTQYTDDTLKEIGNTVAQNFLKRNLKDSELATIMPQLKALVAKGTTTSSKVVGGKNVVTVTPGFSTQAAQTVIEKELTKTAQDDLQKKKLQDNLDWLSQNMAGM